MRAIQDRQSGGHLSAVLPIIPAGWFLAVLTAGAAGVFQSAPSRPPLLMAVAAPPLLLAFAYRVSRVFRGYVLGIDLRLLTALQASRALPVWRMFGARDPAPMTTVE